MTLHNDALLAEPTDLSTNPIAPTPGQATFERALWSSRLIVLIPVISSMVLAIAMFVVATFDTVQNLLQLRSYLDPTPLPQVHDQLRSDLIARVVEAIDGYLLGVVMLIFSMGLYELFIDKIRPASHSDRAKGILVVHCIDDLKWRLGQVILLIMVVKFFERALWVSYESTKDLIIFSTAILLIAGALHLSHLKPKEERS